MPEPRMYRAIFGCAKEHGVSGEQLHDIIYLRFSKTSLKDLTDKECYHLLDGIRGVERGAAVRDPARLRAQGRAGRKSEIAGVEYFVRPRELRMLRDAALLRGWTEEALARFCERQIGRPQPRVMREFNKVFWALKAMNRRDGREAACGR